MREHVTGILNETLALWLDMGIYLVFGFATAGVLSRVLSRDLIARHLGGSRFGAVAKAALFGVPLPLCSCGVIPVGLSLHSRGAGRGATTAFLISTPQTGVDSIAVTWAFLGPLFALLRPMAAFLNGLLGGGAVAWFERKNEPPASSAAGAFDPSADCGECNEAERGNGRVSLGHHALHALRYGFVDFPREIVGWLLAGILIAGVISYFLPSEQEILREYLGEGIMPMLVMMVVGIPLYVCATASVPIVAVLVAKGGLSAGGALVFLMTGPATNAASLLLIARVLGRRTAGLYLGSIVVTSFVCGYALDLAYAAAGTRLSVQAIEHSGHGAMGTSWVAWGGAIALALIVAGGLWTNLRRWLAARRESAESDGEVALEMRVEGMTCSGCANTVRQAAEAVEGVEAARVDLKAGLVRLTGHKFDRATVARAIESQGYRIGEA